MVGRADRRIAVAVWVGDDVSVESGATTPVMGRESHNSTPDMTPLRDQNGRNSAKKRIRLISSVSPELFGQKYYCSPHYVFNNPMSLQRPSVIAPT